MRPAPSIVMPSCPSLAVPIVSALEIWPVRVRLTILPDSWLITSSASGVANTSAKSDTPASAGSKRFVEFSVVGRAVGRRARRPVDAGLEDAERP